LLTHPENAQRLRELKHQAITNAQADWLVSSNFGCAVFIQKDGVKLVHPLQLVAQQL
jgi:glycolate oxidase iron-sulfur subunit